MLWNFKSLFTFPKHCNRQIIVLVLFTEKDPPNDQCNGLFYWVKQCIFICMLKSWKAKRLAKSKKVGESFHTTPNMFGGTFSNKYWQNTFTFYICNPPSVNLLVKVVVLIYAKERKEAPDNCLFCLVGGINWSK